MTSRLKGEGRFSQAHGPSYQCGKCWTEKPAEASVSDCVLDALGTLLPQHSVFYIANTLST